MVWLWEAISTSIGKKMMMAVTGLSFCGFLTAHLLGNLTIYGGGNAFNTYAEKLHTLGGILTIAELGMLFFAIVHVTTGLLLFYQNWKARPVSYAVKKNAGGQNIGSITMPYTGILVLVFVVAHLLNFSFVDKTGTTIFKIVSLAFSNPLYVVAYVLAMIIVAVHIRHGFWSAFQTIGGNHPKYMPLIRGLSVLFGVVIGIGFGSLPIYISLIS
jgi:succinate dehydrogenase / fumarate reductase cytochrome b subunit